MLEVTTVVIYQAPRSSWMADGQMELIFPGDNCFQIIWINHCYHCNCHHNHLILITPVIKLNYITDICLKHHYNKNHHANHFTNALWWIHLSKLLCLSSVLLIFPRALNGPSAAHLNQQVVVTGGYDGSNRDKVLCGILKLIMWNLSSFPGAPVQPRGKNLAEHRKIGKGTQIPRHRWSQPWCCLRCSW